MILASFTLPNRALICSNGRNIALQPREKELAMTSSSKSSKGSGHQCPVCDHKDGIATKHASGDIPCSRCGHLSWFRMQQIDDAIILNLLANMNPERAEIDRVGQLLVHSRDAPHIILNFHKIDFISSTFLNRLIVLRRTVHNASGKVILCGMNQVIREILQINKLIHLFDLSDDTDEALGDL